ncbi:MAG TPA: LamG domain-containing protein [Actinomycetota bacterium]|nr:LamG domain-containing protein [Actinomycetota bacterium]
MAALVTGVTLLALPAAAATAAPQPATPTGTAPAFADSVGIGSSSWFDDIKYKDYDLVRQLLVDLGVKHLRGGIRTDGTTDDYKSFRDLAALGMKYLWITGNPGSNGDAQNVADVNAMLTDPAKLGGTTEALEGPNEFDRFAGTDAVWAQKLYGFMATTYPYMKNHLGFPGVPFYGPSFLSESGRKTYAGLPGSGDLMDRANAHYYPGRELPEEMGNDIDAVADDFDDTVVAGQKVADKNRRPVITETGHSTSTNGGNWWHYGVSERAQSIYMMRTLLTAFSKGVPRTYIHHLLDTMPDPGKTDLERGFGIVGVSGTGTNPDNWTSTPKAAYHSLRRLLAITSGGTGAGHGSSLSYELSGGPATLRKALLSRGDGSYDLFLWNAVPVYNQRTADCNDPRIDPNLDIETRCFIARRDYSVDQGDAFPADVSVTLDLAERAQVSTQRPHSESAFTARGEGKTFSLSVGADPVAVRIDPRYGLAVRADDPRAWLRLNETAGAPVDSSGQGATTQNWTASPTRGQPSGAGETGDGSVTVAAGQRTKVRLAAPVSTGSGATVELWVKPDTTVPDFAEFLTADTADPWRVKMRTYNVNGGFTWGSVYGSSPGSSGEMIFKGFDHGQWHHLVLTMAGGVSTTYLDGKQVGQKTGGETLDLREFTVGAWDSVGYKGGIDELAVYGKALSAGRVCAHYRAAGGSC